MHARRTRTRCTWAWSTAPMGSCTRSCRSGGPCHCLMQCSTQQRLWTSCHTSGGHTWLADGLQWYMLGVVGWFIVVSGVQHWVPYSAEIVDILSYLRCEYGLQRCMAVVTGWCAAKGCSTQQGLWMFCHTSRCAQALHRCMWFAPTAIGVVQPWVQYAAGIVHMPSYLGFAHGLCTGCAVVNAASPSVRSRGYGM